MPVTRGRRGTRRRPAGAAAPRARRTAWSCRRRSGRRGRRSCAGGTDDAHVGLSATSPPKRTVTPRASSAEPARRLSTSAAIRFMVASTAAHDRRDLRGRVVRPSGSVSVGLPAVGRGGRRTPVAAGTARAPPRLSQPLAGTASPACARCPRGSWRARSHRGRRGAPAAAPTWRDGVAQEQRRRDHEDRWPASSAAMFERTPKVTSTASQTRPSRVA